MPASSASTNPSPRPRPVRAYGPVEAPTMQHTTSTTARPSTQRLEQLPEFSAEFYRTLAARNAAYRSLSSDERFVLDLLVVRADAFGGCRFARKDIAHVLAPVQAAEKVWRDDADSWLRVLDMLCARGFVEVHKRSGKANRYVLALPSNIERMRELAAGRRRVREAVERILKRASMRKPRIKRERL